MENKKAPLGIRILAGLYFFALGAYTISLWSLIASGRLGFLFSYNPLAALLIIILTIIMIALAGVWYGLLKLNPTAWKIAMLLFAIGLIINLLSLKIINVIVGIIILWYLYSKKELYLGAEARMEGVVPMEKKEAPLGIKILAGLYFISLGFYLFALAASIPRLGFLFSYNPLAALLIIILTIIMIALAGVWYGLLKLNPTAWKIAMLLFAIGLIINLLSLKIINVIVGIIILWYLYSKKELYLGAEASDRTLAVPQTQEKRGSQTPEEQG